eukprot:TRINITY_DN671_c1_g1_i1.p1 TRINITY_DN671_c1_g1~~TRINITY_DN671_c1_g1_i1.p1  ORF type:complete len:341 (-),score=93.97 TRINITY_DN671_c1_g1_i1:247-1269(-)
MNISLVLVIFTIIFAVDGSNVSIDVLINSDNTPYVIGDVLIGVPGQKLPIAFDIVSDQPSYVAILKHREEYRAVEKDLPLFNTTASKTLHKTHATQVRDCELSGSFDSTKIYDTIAVSPQGFVKNFFFEMATEDHECSDFTDKRNGFSGRLNLNTEGNLVSELLKQGRISKPYIQLVNRGDSHGDLVFGDISSTISEWVPTLSSYTWVIDGKSASMGDLTFPMKKVTFSFSNAGLYGPVKYIQQIYKLLNAEEIYPGIDIYKVNCDEIHSLPNVNIIVGNNSKLTLRSSEYVVKSNGMCLLNIYAGDSMVGDEYLWSVGASIAVQNTVIYDVENHAIGFD